MGFRHWFLSPLIRRITAIMATVSEIQTQIAALVEKVKQNTDATEAIKTYIAGIKAQLADVQAQLAAALAGQDPAALQAVSDQLKAVADAIDADSAAEAALVNTDAAPV